MQALHSGDANQALANFKALSVSTAIPEAFYFQAIAAMKTGDWDQAIEALNWIGSHNVAVFENSAATLIPLAEFKLSECYAGKGDTEQAGYHRETAEAMWKEADRDLKGRDSDGETSGRHRHG